MSFYEDASLVMIPSGYKSGKIYSQKPLSTDGQLTFTRASEATRVASNGLIEKVRTNLVLQSQTLSVSPTWTAYSGTTVTENAVAAPDGTLTAEQITGASGAFRGIRQTITSSAIPHTFSVYLRSATGSTTTARIWVDGTNITATVTTSWQRFLVTGTTAASFDVQISTAIGLAIDVYAWGAQLETGDIATDYIPTTTAAVSVGPVSGLPRLDYLNSTCPKLLLEPQRTNLVTFSEQINNAAWLDAGGTTTANTAISPSGYQDADTLTGKRFQSSFASNTYTASCFAKKVDGDNKFVLRFDVPTLKFAQFDLSTGTIDSFSSGYSATITPYGNGWYRCTLTSPAATAITNFVIISASGGVSNTYVWGAQLEVGAYATSYIPTLGASVTRVADAASKTGITSLIGQTEGVLFVDYNYQANRDTSGSIPIVIVSGSSEAYIFITTAGALRFELYNAGVLQALITGTIGAVGRKKIAFAYKANDFAAYMNGVQIGIDTSGTVGAMAAVHIGSYYVAGYSSVSGISQALLFKTRLTNDQLAELTAL